MVLHAKNGLGFMPQAFDGPVIQIEAVDGHIGGQARRVHGKAMVLGGDFHAAGFQIFHRLVATPVAKLEFEGFAAQRLAQNLVAETNAENGNAGGGEGLHFPDDVIQRGRVAGAVGEKNSRRFVLQGIRRRGGGGQDLDSKAMRRSRRRMLYFIP